MENAIRARRAHFSLLFCWKSDLGLSWRHLGPSWQNFWAVLGTQDASKMRYLGPKTAARRDQDLPKSGPKHLPRRTWQPKTAMNFKKLENDRQKSMGYPSGLGIDWQVFWNTLVPRVCTIFTSMLYHLCSLFQWKYAQEFAMNENPWSECTAFMIHFFHYVFDACFP